MKAAVASCCRRLFAAYGRCMRRSPRLRLYASYALCAGLAYALLVSALRRSAWPVFEACRPPGQLLANDTTRAGEPREALCDRGTVFGIYAGVVLGVAMGQLAGALRLPPLLGMLAAGLLLRNVPVFVYGPPPAALIDRRAAGALRRAAFALILLQGGLGLDLAALRKLKGVVLRLAACPCLAEALTVALLTWLVFGYPFEYGLLLGFALGAVSPAICVPAMMRVAGRGLGVAKGVPTLVVAASGVDDVLAIAGFSALLALVFQSDTGGGGALHVLCKLLAPLAQLGGGTLLGVAVGALLAFVPPSSVPHLTAWRTAAVLLACESCVFACGRLGAAGAGPVACLVAPVVAKHFWDTFDGRRACVEEKESGDAAEAETEEQADGNSLDGSAADRIAMPLDAIWHTFGEPLLFVLIGAELDLGAIQPSVIGRCVLILLCGLVVRTLVAFVSVLGAGLNFRERVYVSLAWLPKASVQAALAPAFYDAAVESGAGAYQIEAGIVIMSVAVLSIVITAPLGAAAMTLTAGALLSADGQPGQGQEEAKKSAEDCAKGGEEADGGEKAPLSQENCAQ